MARIRVKDGVQPQLVRLIAAVANAAQGLTKPNEVWITAGIDGSHGAQSLHYSLRAIDVRSKNMDPTIKSQFLDVMRLELGPDYDVFLEASGTANEHFHLEYDP